MIGVDKMLDQLSVKWDELQQERNSLWEENQRLKTKLAKCSRALHEIVAYNSGMVEVAVKALDGGQ
jgi:predicted nuclease with TOPRIM domain